jgi:hypothetical protein
MEEAKIRAKFQMLGRYQNSSQRWRRIKDGGNVGFIPLFKFLNHFSKF